MAGIDRRAAFGAFVPLLAATGAVIAAQATGTTVRTIQNALDTPWLIFGLFADRFSVLAFAIIFVLARLLVLVFVATRPHVLLRAPLLAIAAAIVLVATLYPTFGGFVARPGFIGGGVTLINSVVAHPTLATLIGGAVAGLMLALVTGLARLFIDWSWGLTWGKIGRGLLALIAYLFMGAVLAGGWSVIAAGGALFPRAPMTIVEAIGLIGLLIVATAPQVMTAALGDAARRPAKD